MRRARVALFVLLLACVLLPAGPAAALGYSTLLVYTPVWGPSGATITFTYGVTQAGQPCPPAPTPSGPIYGSTVARFSMDGTVFRDGVPFESDCSAQTSLVLPQAIACSAHTFTAAIHNPGDPSGVAQTTQTWPANYPTTGPYGCMTGGPHTTLAPPGVLPPRVAAATPTRSTAATTAGNRRATTPTPTPTPSGATPTEPASLTSAPASAAAVTTASPAGTAQSGMPAVTPVAASLRATPAGSAHLPWWLAAGAVIAAAAAGAAALFRLRWQRR